MKKQKTKKQTSPLSIAKPAEPMSRSSMLVNIVYALILASAIALLLFKAHYTGITFDEAITQQRFTRDLYTATHRFDSTNNHVLNSIFICWSSKMFGSYEHYIRIPSAAAGIIYLLATAYIIRKLISSGALRVAGLATVCFIPMVFSYLFFARGYAFALAGIAAYIAFVVRLLEHPIKFKHWPLIAIVFSLLNFLAFGSMLTCVLTLLSLNAAFVLLFSARIYKEPLSRLKAIVVTGTSIFTLSAIMTHLLYSPIYDKILKSNKNVNLVNIVKNWKGWPSFVDYLHSIFVIHIFKPNTSLGTVTLYITAALLVAAIVMALYKLYRSFAQSRLADHLARYQQQNFIILTTIVSIVTLFVYSVVLGKCPGLIRSNLFLAPLAMISALALIDRFIHDLSPKALSRIVCALTVATTLTIFARNRPYIKQVSGGGIAISAPVLRRLRKFDPDKTWNITFSKKMKIYKTTFYYYKRFGYKFNVFRFDPKDTDVYICKRKERPKNTVCLDWEYFDRSKCAVVFTKPLDPQRAIIQAVPVKR